MAPKPASLTYSNVLYRVKVDFTLELCRSQPQPPPELVQKTKNKLESLKAGGQIAHYRIYEERFLAMWKKAVAMPSTPELDRKVFSVSLGSGAPELPGLLVDKSTQEKSICTLTFSAPQATMQTWRIEWLKLIVRREMDRLGIRGIPCQASLLGALLKAQSGESVRQWPISAIAGPEPMPGAPNDKPWTLVWNKGRKEVAAIIYDIKALSRIEVLTSFFDSVQVACTKAAQSAGVPLRVLQQESLLAINAASLGPEAFDLDLPFVQLVISGTAGTAPKVPMPKMPQPVAGPQTLPKLNAGATSVAAKHPGAPVPPPSLGKPNTTPFRQHKKEADLPTGDYPGKGLLPLSISQDRMQVKIGNFETSYYDKFPGAFDAIWFQNELKRQGIVFGIREDFVTAIVDAIAQKQPITGMWAAAGEPGTPGKEPFLFADQREFAGDGGESEIDMRAAQNTRIVKKGHLLAEIRFRQPGKSGKDVKGNEVLPPDGEALSVTASDGVESRGRKYYATADGIPTIDPTGSISLSRSLLHDGDVNLASGNINFDGPVEINGSVETGASVFATGDIVIHGHMNGGKVRSYGSIIVEGSITTGESGRIEAGGGIQADFVQNSRIICGGDLVVNKSVLSSNITVGGGIQFTQPNSLLSGGRIRCGLYIKVSNLGQPNGSPTEINIGSDAKIEDRLQTLQRRIEKLARKNEEDRNNLREVIRKKDAQMTKKHVEMRTSLQDRVQRGGVILAKLRKATEDASAKRAYNTEARIIVSNRCVPNVKITMAGSPVVVNNEIAGVVLMAKKWSGSHIAAIEDWMERERLKADKNDSRSQRSSRRAG